MDGIKDLKAERVKYAPKGISMEGDSITVNGGIGDGVNDGGPAYCVDTVEGGRDEEKYS